MNSIYGNTTTTPINPDAFSGGGIGEGNYVEKVEGNQIVIQLYGVNPNGEQVMLDVEDTSKFEAGYVYDTIARRQINGNIMTETPVKDLDCANKKYVDDYIIDIGATATSASNGVIRLDKKIDDIVGDIETLLGGI